GGSYCRPAAEYPLSESRPTRRLADVGRGGVHGRLRARLFPQILAQAGRAHQEAPASRVTAHGEAGEASKCGGDGRSAIGVQQSTATLIAVKAAPWQALPGTQSEI